MGMFAKTSLFPVETRCHSELFYSQVTAEDVFSDCRNCRFESLQLFSALEYMTVSPCVRCVRKGLVSETRYVQALSLLEKVTE